MTEIAVKGDVPPAQYGQTILYHDGFLYTIGGTEGFDYTCDVYRYYKVSLIINYGIEIAINLMLF